MEYGCKDPALPADVQTFLWKQISPFIRPKLGKLHEASCMFCQHAPGHYELKESCKFFEKVLVQNVLIGLPPNLTESIKSVSRWRLIQASFPYVMHSAASLLHNRNDTSFLSIGAAETKLLYTLHWIVLDSAEECAEADYERGAYNNSPFYYLFPVTAISLFVYLFAPICHHLKESDFQNYRLENGLKLWQALWDYQHPDTACFTSHVKPKPRSVWDKRLRCPLQFAGDVFPGRKGSADNGVLGAESPPSQSASLTCSDHVPVRTEAKPPSDEDASNTWLSSPKDTIFPETIPEESSSTEEEHVVIFRLPSLPETDSIKESPIYTAETSLFQVAMGQTATTSKTTLTIEQVTAISGSDTRQLRAKPPIHNLGSSTDKESVSSIRQQETTGKPQQGGRMSTDICAATFLDVAVLRCLFVPLWPEEGVYWALQFLYHRLRVISEELPAQQQPRRRSNSLPSPKIEVSVYHSPELRSNEPKDFIEVPDVKDLSYLTESPYLGHKSLQEETCHTRRASEKVKIRMKMADLKAFVETRLLSKSEKTLEKIGSDETKPLYEEEYHRSLDTGDERFSRPSSAFAKLFEVKSDLRTGGMIKGKSMPSLRYIGEVQLERPKQRGMVHGGHVHAIPNPIITVTEHTPTPSPDYLKRQGSLDVDSLMDAMSVPESAPSHHKASLTRSQTDSNISYPGEQVPEAQGAASYITKDGDIDYLVVLKAVQAAAQRDYVCCTLRVCEVVLNLVELLLELGVLRHESLTTTRDSAVSPHCLAMRSVLKVIKHLGCPHGCADGQRGLPVDFLRSQSHNILAKLHRASSRQFGRFLRDMMRRQPLHHILDFFHAYVGFCVDPSSLLSPLNQKRSCSKSPEVGAQGGYATNFGGGSRGVEGHVIACCFKTLVTRLATTLKQLKTQENMALYCDVRQLMTYVKEAHGGVFRRVALSGLLDSANRPHRREADTQTTRVVRHYHQSDADDQMDMGAGSCYVMDERGSRKLLFKKRSTSSTCPSLLETEGGEEPGKTSQSPLSNVRKKQFMLTPRVSERNLGVGDMLLPTNKERKQSRFHVAGIMSWFRREHGHVESTDSYDESDSPVEGGMYRQPSLHHMTGRTVHKTPSSSQVNQTLQKAKRRVEEHFIKLGFGKGRKKDGSMEDTQASYLSRRSSLECGDHSRDSEFVVLKERKLVPLLPVLNGMVRFSFLLETCPPGSVPDPYLLAAVLDLPHAPVVAKAALLLECSYFVHLCNRGQWPAWMKLNFPMFRPSGPVASRGPSTGQRRSHLLQRSAGNMFYQWAEALGSRLEEMLLEDKKHVATVVSMVSEENKQKELLAEDEEEDFLDESSVSTAGTECPMALRLVACNLLLEVTAYLRETYHALPKTSRTSAKERPPPWERLYSREATNRRWSMALSSMGHSQASAQSLQSIPVDREAARKISFVHPEPDNESEGSSNTTVTMQGEEGGVLEEKKARRPPPQIRPFLSRRGTAGATAGSFKRRSFKLGRSTKDTKDLDSDLSAQQCTLMSTVNVKRTDSIQSKRKVSSLSDRSDNSEQGCPSGEESPAILSDDQPPESPSDSNDAEDLANNLPWMKAVVQLANSFNFYCSHQSFCHPFCYRRHMRASSRLIKSVRKVYGEQFGPTGGEAGRQHHDDTKKERCRGRKVSDQTSTQASPVRRKDSVSRRDRMDGGASTRFLSSQRDSSRDIADHASDKAESQSTKKVDTKPKELPPIQKYIKNHLSNVLYTPLAVLVKGAVVLAEDVFVEMLPVAWQLLLEPNQEVAATAASLFILAAVKAPNQAMELMHYGLQHHDPATRINAILRFQVLWKLRYQVWPRMEEGAHLKFKVPPPGIEFTLPSPKIGKESLPVVDPPWMPKVKTKVEEVTISQESHRSLVTATKTRKKQQTELIKMALQAQEDKKRAEREGFLITTIPITVQAAFEPSLHHAAGDDHEDGNVGDEEMETAQRSVMHHIHTAHSLFPSCLCSAVIQIINLLDDAAVSADGNAVYEVSYQVIWSCLVEDSALFLRYVLERLTRDRQDLMFKVLRHLIRFVPKLPQQAAFALYNYIIGYVMFYVRSPQEEGQKLIGAALSILWMVVHSVHGIMFKDLKQILRKEQCDASILLTANVPSAKKIIVHGPQDPDVGGIPSQFPVQEDTQFCQILRESLDFFGIDEAKHKEYFLVDHKTHQIHNPSSYVRDFYFFKRSQYPQLELVHMKTDEAYNALQRQELLHKFVEIGKVLLTWAILKNVDMVVQRVVFLHEELMKLPAFPRKALEADLDLYKGGEMGKELLGLDVLHKFMWVRLIARMFEAMAGNFAYSGDIHLFLNVLNGAIYLHSEDACILRYVTATYINAVHHFKNIFSTNGYLLVMPTLLQLYSNHQTNALVKTTVEYAVKQFYLMNRKPFILQMFGSVSSILDTDEDSQYGDAHKVQASCLFNLLLSLETPSPDPLNIGELVKEEKPLKAIDFCYHDENEMVSVLDCISLCVMVISYSADSTRGHQMLTILEAILPSYIQQIQLPTYNHGSKTEKDIINQLAIAVKTLVNNCESLAKNYNGPQKTSPEHKGSSQRNYSRGPYSPGYDFEDDSHSKYMSDHSRSKVVNDKEMDDPECLRSEFRRPRDILLSLVAQFLTKSSQRLSEINKKGGQDGKTIELLDIKSHVRLADVAHSLLKVSPYDPDTMACRGLQRYMNDVLPSTEWSNEAMRPALIMILRRLDKTFNKIYKKPSIRRHTDWEAAANLLKGIYETLSRYPYIVHMQHLKTLITTCQSLIVGEPNTGGMGDCVSSATAALMSQVPPPHFCSTVVRLIALQMIAVGENYSLEQVCGGSSVLPTAEKTETMLMNLLMPLCLRVGSGRKDVPKMRQADINFALTVVLHAMCPPTAKTAPVNAQNIKTASEMRCGSFTITGRERPLKTSRSLVQVSFLALKIMVICFESELVVNWWRVATTVREMGKYADIGPEYWGFLDFVVSHHTPLFVLLQPYILKKLSAVPTTDHERHLQFIVREKLRGYSLPIAKGKATLLMDLAHEMKALKEKLEDKKYGEHRDSKQSYMAEMQQLYETVSQARTHRPSLIELLTGERGNTQEPNPATQPPRGSVSSVEPSECGAVDTQSSTTASDSAGRVHADKTHQPTAHDEPKVPTQKCDAFLPLQKASKLRFVSSVELRHSSGETSTTPLTPGSPVDDSSGEQGKPRLQRSKAQSRKTFRLRKSRKSHVQVPHGKTETEGQQEGQMMELRVSMTREQQRLPLPGSLDNRAAALRDHSWDDTSQTSSASGYNESYSMLTMSLESPMAPPLASPDVHDLPSTSSTVAANCSLAEGSSPDSSINSGTGEDTALLERTLSQHSLLITFDTQDEDTLI